VTNVFSFQHIALVFIYNIIFGPDVFNEVYSLSKATTRTIQDGKTFCRLILLSVVNHCCCFTDRLKYLCVCSTSNDHRFRS